MTAVQVRVVGVVIAHYGIYRGALDRRHIANILQIIVGSHAVQF